MIDAYPCVLAFGCILVKNLYLFSRCECVLFHRDRRVSVYTSRNREFTAFRPLRPFHVGVAIAGTYVIDTIFQFVFLDSETGYVFSFIQVDGRMPGRSGRTIEIFDVLYLVEFDGGEIR